MSSNKIFEYYKIALETRNFEIELYNAPKIKDSNSVRFIFKKVKIIRVMEIKL